jgi:CRP-like cAMP-binding protein
MIDIDILLSLGAVYKKVAAGEVIFSEGVQAIFYHQLVSGSVRWVNIDDEGKEFIQNMIEPGECFGEMPLFDEDPFAASAIADTDSVIIRLHRSTFLQLMLDRPDIHFSFTKLMAQRLRFKFMLLKELSSHDPEHSIISLLNYLKQNKKSICNKCYKVNLTRQQIANMTGLRVETVIRTIRQLHEKGQLLIEKGKVYC